MASSSSSNEDSDLDPLWQNIDWAIGQALIMGWDGTEVTPQIKTLIEDYHLGSVILTAKNLQSASHAVRLVQELQTIAKNAGHPQPLLICLDQENGAVNSLFDEDYISQFPSAMGIAATGQASLAYDIAKATATEVSACGVNLILGPVLDVLYDSKYQPLGVRATGDDPYEVSQYGLAALRGIRDAGIASCGKHFPSHGILESLSSNLAVPIITQRLEELSLGALIPFRNAIASGLLDSMLVGGCGISNPSMNVSHACLSGRVVDELLRNELGFKGVAISECLEMEALSYEFGIQNGVVMAVKGGCDLVLLCRTYDVQRQAIKGLQLAYETGIITKNQILASLRRILSLKSRCTSWCKALNPSGISLLSQVRPSHLRLSRNSYDNSIAVIRDKEKLLPLSGSMQPGEEILLLTPLVKPLPTSINKGLIETKYNYSSPASNQGLRAHQAHERNPTMSGEGVFREFGQHLARYRKERVLHTSYTANGVTAVHDSLIHRASCVIAITADGTRNLYQVGFTKHVDLICSKYRRSGSKKQLIVVAVSSPYDFDIDESIGTYICTFDFTEHAMSALIRVLVGEIDPPIGTMPGTLRKNEKVLKSRQPWLVEGYDRSRDAEGLANLLRAVHGAKSPNLEFLRSTTPAAFEPCVLSIKEAHFVVRNSSTQTLYGFVATYYTSGVGILGAILVDPGKQNMSIGRSLHNRALQNLERQHGIKKVRIGLPFPGVFLGIPSNLESSLVKDWFASSGWDISSSRKFSNMIIKDLASWIVPEDLFQTIRRASITFDLIHGLENAESVLHHVRSLANPEVMALYKYALGQTKSCGVIRAKDLAGNLIATVIISSPNSALSTYIPVLSHMDKVGGIIAPVLPSAPHSTSVLQCLTLMGAQQCKNYRASRAVLVWIADDAIERLQAIGFETLHAFEEITSPPGFSLLPSLTFMDTSTYLMS